MNLTVVNFVYDASAAQGGNRAWDVSLLEKVGLQLLSIIYIGAYYTNHGGLFALGPGIGPFESLSLSIEIKSTPPLPFFLTVPIA